jgi:hypothetical protein
MPQRHVFFTGPKEEPAVYDDAPYPVYPTLPGTPQGQGGYYVPQPGYPARVRSLWKFKAIMWLVIFLVTTYCVYYLLPFSHYSVLGITLHP